MEAPVSYIVTVYNKAEFLGPVLAAIELERIDTGGEIIVVDDGSTDESPDILGKFSKNKTGVTIFTQENAGVAAATTRGIEAAKEKYLRLVDGDDIVTQGSTRHLIEVLETTKCGFAFGQYTNDVLHASVTPQTRIVDDALKRMLIKQPFVPAATLGLTSIMQRAMPLSPRFKTAQDFYLGIRLARLTKFAETTALCCLQPVNSAGLSANKAEMFRETVLMALELGQEKAWAGRYRRLAIARSAGRARNYLRRHAKGRYMRKAGVSLLATIVRIPFFWPYRRLMIYIANGYTRP